MEHWRSNFKQAASVAGAGANATQNSADFWNPTAMPISVICTTANRSLAGTWTPSLQLKLPDPTLLATNPQDPLAAYQGAGARYINLWTAAAAIAAAGDFMYQLCEDAAATVTQVTESKVVLLPPVYRLQFVYGGTGTFDLTAYVLHHADM